MTIKGRKLYSDSPLRDTQRRMYVGEKCQVKMKAEPFEEMPWQQVQTDYPAQGLSCFRSLRGANKDNFFCLY